MNTTLYMLYSQLFWPLLIAVLLFILNIFMNWVIFKKAGRPAWAAIVPFYSDYIIYEIFWGNGTLFLLPAGCTAMIFLPTIGSFFYVALVVIRALTMYKKCEAFGRGLDVAVGLFFLEPIFNILIAFKSGPYRGVPQDGFSYEQLNRKLGFDEWNRHESDAEKETRCGAEPSAFDEAESEREI